MIDEMTINDRMKLFIDVEYFYGFVITLSAMADQPSSFGTFLRPSIDTFVPIPHGHDVKRRIHVGWHMRARSMWKPRGQMMSVGTCGECPCG